MALSNEGKFDLMYQFLAQHNFEMDTNVPGKLKCGECQKLLINPHIGLCLCKLCRNCIDNMLTNEIDKCPGNKDDCRDSKISKYFPDYSTNSDISKLVLKCPNELCQYKCELVKMEDHFRLCSSKCVKCPFFGVGCEDDKLVEDKMSDHLQLEGYKHNKILIEMIGILRNEVNLLKGHDERNRDEIETIARMNGETQRNKLQIEAVLTENAVIKDEIKLLKEEKKQMAAEMNNFRRESEIKMDNSRKQMRKERRDELGTEVRRIKDEMEKWNLQLTRRVDGVEKRQDRKVDQISYQRKKYTQIFSEMFYSKTVYVLLLFVSIIIYFIKK